MRKDVVIDNVYNMMHVLRKGIEYVFSIAFICKGIHFMSIIV